MIIGLIGFALLVWAIWAGIGTRENNRAIIFQGSVGYFVNLLVIATAVICILTGFL